MKNGNSIHIFSRGKGIWYLIVITFFAALQLLISLMMMGLAVLGTPQYLRDMQYSLIEIVFIFTLLDILPVYLMILATKWMIKIHTLLFLLAIPFNLIIYLLCQKVYFKMFIYSYSEWNSFLSTPAFFYSAVSSVIIIIYFIAKKAFKFNFPEIIDEII